jgi:hypothetical protein
MSGNTSNSPMLKAAGLWAKTSVKGGQYLAGRLGGVKVLILENRDRRGDDDPSHHLFFVEAPDCPTGVRRSAVRDRGHRSARGPPAMARSRGRLQQMEGPRRSDQESQRPLHPFVIHGDCRVHSSG